MEMSSIDHLAQCPYLRKYCIDTPWSTLPLYIRLRGFIGVLVRERRETSSRSIVSTTTYRRRYGTPCLVSRLEIVPRGQKTHGSTTVEGRWRGGKREGSWKHIGRRERAGWIGKKEKRERETAIIVGNGWGMNAVIWRCMHHRLCHLTRDDRPT